ncbi:YhfC family glutamic-type intramembrane protease [Clostridium sp. Marseille-Q7071]
MNSASIISAGISGAMCVLLPIIVLIYFKKKEKISLKPVIIGAIVFFIFTQILERLLHMVVIGNNLIKNPIFFSIYGALTAGIFEEVGRFIAFKTVLKNNHEWKDGIAFGIGHGGIEAIIIGVFSSVQFIIYSNLINRGLFDII